MSSGSAPMSRLGETVWRPVQYLGSKLRALPAITEAVHRLCGAAPATVGDAFCGTSVVGQALASSGYTIRAVDASPAAALLARATLGVGRPDRPGAPADAATVPRLWSQVEAMVEREREVRARPWADSIAAERAAIDAKDAEQLAAIDASLPQVWRPDGATTEQLSLFAAWSQASRSGAPYPHGLLAAVYAGTYLGLDQAVFLESTLAVVARLRGKGEIGGWEADALATAALHGASAAAYSAGKHFAQPHSLSPGKDLSFHHNRLLTDRATNLREAISTAASQLSAIVRHRPLGAQVCRADVEEVPHLWRGCTAVYADPPYTAQQYSRFYHVLDVMAEGTAKALQPGNRGGKGSYTKGLYPAERFISQYCRSSQARGALMRFAEAVQAGGAHLVLSYSVSRTDVTGNARMVTFGALVDTVSEVFGRQNIAVDDVALAYRPFNASSVDGSKDDEVLVVCRNAA